MHTAIVVTEDPGTVPATVGLCLRRVRHRSQRHTSHSQNHHSRQEHATREDASHLVPKTHRNGNLLQEEARRLTTLRHPTSWRRASPSRHESNSTMTRVGWTDPAGGNGRRRLPGTIAGHGKDTGAGGGGAVHYR